MIFVTVGTHEQQFNRLIKYMDEYAQTSCEEIIIQTGFSTYKPHNCKWQKLFSYSEMEQNVKAARIVITHGGPSSFIAPLQIGKIPVVVPRRKEFDEHINDHQVNFCIQVKERQKNIILVENTDELKHIIDKYENLVANMTNSMIANNNQFCWMLEQNVNEILKHK